MCWWLKDKSCALPVTFLSVPNETVTANVADIHGLVEEASRLVNRKDAVDSE